VAESDGKRGGWQDPADDRSISFGRLGFLGAVRRARHGRRFGTEVTFPAKILINQVKIEENPKKTLKSLWKWAFYG
jgi:hypothetical protein